MVGNCLKASELMELYEQTKVCCGHRCEDCGMWMPVEKKCYHELEKLWKEWNNIEHDKFYKLLRGENETNNIQ